MAPIANSVIPWMSGDISVGIVNPNSACGRIDSGLVMSVSIPSSSSVPPSASSDMCVVFMFVDRVGWFLSL